VLAWVPVVLVEVFAIPNEWLLALLVPPFELALWLVAGWVTHRLMSGTRLGWLPRAAAALAFGILCVHFTNWGVFHPSSYYATHRYAFHAVAAGVRNGTIASTDDYYGRPLPWHLRDLSTTGTAAAIGKQDGRPVVFLPQWAGIPDDAAGYVYFDGDPHPDLIVDLFGEPAHLAGGKNLGGGWWYLRPGDQPQARSRRHARGCRVDRVRRAATGMAGRQVAAARARSGGLLDGRQPRVLT
jgi:hypothetical protein